MLRIGLVPISAKPYHRGHHALVLKAAAENDEVVLFVSLSDRIRPNEFPILGSDMHRIWKEELEPIIPSNVRVEYGGSPVRKVYELLGAACDVGSDNIFTVYSDPTDTAENYPESNRTKYLEPLCAVGQIIFAAEEDPESMTRGSGTPNIRGEDLRQALADSDFQEFASLLPSEANAARIYDILLDRNLSENKLLKDFVAAIIK
jgi:hypothetical protein